MKIKLILFFVFLSTISSGQDTLNLLNGKVKLVDVQSMDFDFIYFKKIKKDGTSGKLKKKNLDYIFSVSKLDTCIYLYKKDSLFDNYWSIKEMKSYLEGRRQARKHFKPYKTILIGAGVGTGIAFYSLFPIKYAEKKRETYVRDTMNNSIDTLHYNDYSSLTIPIPYWEIIPLGVYIYSASKVGNIDRYNADDVEMFSEDMFVLGYQETVINRKTYSAVGASLGSFLTTILSYILLNPVEN